MQLTTLEALKSLSTYCGRAIYEDGTKGDTIHYFATDGREVGYTYNGKAWIFPEPREWDARFEHERLPLTLPA